MPLTSFPPHQIESTSDGAESGNQLAPRHFIVRGALAIGRYLWLGLNAWLSEGNPADVSFGNGGNNAWGTARAANLSTTVLPTATLPTVTPQGAGAGTTIVYLVVAKLGDGSNSPAGPTGQTTTGYANITTANQGINVSWTAVPGAYSYDVYRTTAPTTPSTTGKIANVVGATTLLDNGLAGDGTTAPVTNSTGAQTLNASAGGSQNVCSSLTELMTLNTGGGTTDSVAKLLPANSVILGVAVRVTTAITVASAFSVGDASTAARFLATGTTLTAGSTAVGLAHLSGTVAFVQAAAASLRITTTGTPGAGAIRVTVFYETFIPPTA